MDASDKMYKYILGRNLMGAKSSARNKDSHRTRVAREQAALKAVPLGDIICIVNEFLREMEMSVVTNPVFTDFELEDGLVTEKSYENLKAQFDIDDCQDIVWMKFSDEGGGGCGYLCSVGTDADINFIMPPNEDAYTEKIKPRTYKYNTSGVIMHQLDKKYDTSFVLVFPLKNLKTLKRGDIETGIGNYLIAHDVPILNYYSHKF